MNCNSNYNMNRMTNGCGQDYGQMTVTMAYVPWQQFGRTFELDKALQVGTIFADLDRPFLGRGGACNE